MPWNRKDYPLNWMTEIRPALFARALSRCEGSPAYPGCRVKQYTFHPETGSKVVLTMAHLCRCDPKCGELSHLRLLCQRCHLALDVELHAQHAAETFRRQSEAAGQLRLFTDPDSP
jgi:hypothetical protein